MKIAALIPIVLSVLISACATYPQSGEDQATHHVEKARAAISKEDNQTAAWQIETALTRPTGDTKVKELFASYPKARDVYLAYLEKCISEITNAYEAGSILEKVTVATSAKVFSDAQAHELVFKLNNAITSGNRTGSIPFDLSDNIESFPELKLPEHRQIIIDRSITKLQENSGNRPVAALMNYVQQVGRNSNEGRRIESLLPTMQIRRNELDTVAKLFPAFAGARRDEITARVVFQVKNGDRLLSEDILSVLRSRVRGIEWSTTPTTKTTTVTVERVRHDERTMPERSQTITYAQHEVNLLGAALLMPQNASYIYEVVSGGTEIEYGYVIVAEANGKTIHDQLVRGKIEGEYRRCQNARIQNVFGGVTSAGFVANDDMQQRCSGRNSFSIDELRKDVLSKIVDGVLQIPSIKAIHDVN